MVMKFYGNGRGEVRVKFLALLVLKPHIFMCGFLTLFRLVRANVRLNIAIPSLLLFLNYSCSLFVIFFCYMQSIFVIVAKMNCFLIWYIICSNFRRDGRVFAAIFPASSPRKSDTKKNKSVFVGGMKASS